MVRSDTIQASIGIRISISDLIAQINETNFEPIQHMLTNGFIEDENNMFNRAYNEVVSALPETAADCKAYLEEEFTTLGTYKEYKDGSEENTLSEGSLMKQWLLVPIKDLLTTERWGYERYGTNGNSRPMNFDITCDLELYKDIQHCTLAFMLRQSS